MIDFGERVVGNECHAELFERFMRWRQRQGVAAGIDLIRTCDNREREFQVCRAARQRPDDSDVGLLKCRHQAVPGLGAYSIGRLVTEYPAIMRGIADRRGNVAAQLQTCHPCGKRCRRPTGGAAGTSRQIPGIVRAPVDVIGALSVHEPRRHVRLAEYDRAGLQKPVHHDSVGLCDIVLERGKAPGCRQAFDIEGLLDGHRQTMQRAKRFAAGKRPVRLYCPLARAAEIFHDDGVDGRIVGTDTLDKIFKQFERADLPGAQPARKFSSGLKRESCHRDLLHPAGMPPYPVVSAARPSRRCVG